MSTRQLTLKGKNIFSISGLDNVHQLALQSGVSAQTAYKYASEPERVHAIDLAVLTRFLVNGAKLTEEQVLNLRLGDILEFAG